MRSPVAPADGGGAEARQTRPPISRALNKEAPALAARVAAQEMRRSPVAVTRPAARDLLADAVLTPVAVAAVAAKATPAAAAAMAAAQALRVVGPVGTAVGAAVVLARRRHRAASVSKVRSEPGTTERRWRFSSEERRGLVHVRS